MKTTKAKIGSFITFEGTECSGKTTQIELLKKRLALHSCKETVFVREPGGTPLGEELRSLFKNHTLTICSVAEVLLLNAARAQLVAEVIAPALIAGKTVVCDRYTDSTVAYQHYGRCPGVSAAGVASANNLGTGGIKPVLTILLMVPYQISLLRLAGRQGLKDRIEKEGPSFFHRVEEGYRQMAAAEPSRFVMIDGTAPIKHVEGLVWQAVSSLLSQSL